MAAKIALSEQVTQDGRTYPAGAYEVVPNNTDFLKANQIHERDADKLKHNYPDVVGKPAAPKPVEKGKGYGKK